ncbi:MAG: amidohydrolase family protein [Desulfurococcales archaeon]|nr:amidohydrolase family protein [Desulfurococcales archaeon]
MRVVDFHLHLPWWAESPWEASLILGGEMDRAGVSLGLLISIEASLDRFRRLVNRDTLSRALGRSADLLVSRFNGGAGVWGLDVGDFIAFHESALRRVSGDLERVLEVSRLSGGKLLPVAAYKPGMDPAEFATYIDSLGSIVGVKVYPTLFFSRPDSRRMRALYRELERRRGSSMVIVHTGCDPGVWELPEYCRFARPSFVERVARAFKDTYFIVAHMGAYSALNHGVYFGEALRACGRDNVYLDTSSVDPLLVERAVRECGEDSIVYGSDYPYVVGHSMADSLYSIQSLGLESRALGKILGGNALKLLSEVAGIK